MKESTQKAIDSIMYVTQEPEYGYLMVTQDTLDTVIDELRYLSDIIESLEKAGIIQKVP